MDIWGGANNAMTLTQLASGNGICGIFDGIGWNWSGMTNLFYIVIHSGDLKRDRIFSFSGIKCCM